MIDHSNKNFCNASKNSFTHFISLFFQKPNTVFIFNEILTPSLEGMITQDLITSKLKKFYTTDSNIHYTQRTFKDYMGFLKEFHKK